MILVVELFKSKRFHSEYMPWLYTQSKYKSLIKSYNTNSFRTRFLSLWSKKVKANNLQKMEMALEFFLMKKGINTLNL